ncbi:MAG: GerW family sporulation protein [Sarcina sp.]
MENNHPIESLMKSTLENLKDMIDVNTVVGDGIEAPDGSFILPISKVSFGFASGGSDIPKNKDGKFPFGGGSGSGVSVKPVAFLVIKDDAVRILPVDQNNTYDRIVDTIPQVIDMLKNHLCKTKTSCDINSNEENDIK